MVDIRHVLCPIDFSEASGRALDRAVVLAQWYHADLTALHVIPPLPLQPPIFLGALVDTMSPSGAPGTDRAVRERELRAWLQPAVRAGVKTHVVVLNGDPAARILEHLSAAAGGLVVIGTHGLRGFDRFIIGSVAETVLRKASCPVLTVPPAVATPPTLPFTRVLCPVDFSPSAVAALRLAASLAQAAKAHLTVMSVVDWPEHEAPEFARFEGWQIRAQVEDEVRRRLAALIAKEVPDGVACEEVVHGKPYRQILQAAERDHADLIVMGVRGRHALDLTLFGSTTNQVVRRAACPVLTFRP